MNIQSSLDAIAQKYGFYFSIQNIFDIESLLIKNGDYYVTSILTELEFGDFKRFKVKKRKVEWLSGRIAAKQALGTYFDSLNTENRVSKISVLNGDKHAPYLDGYPDLNISISHSNLYAIAAIAPFRIGIDIEKIEPRSDSLTDYFFSNDEMQVIMNHQNEKDDFITRFWSRKEAISKFLKLGGELNFKQINTTNNEIEISKEKIKLISEKCEDYWISIAL